MEINKEAECKVVREKLRNTQKDWIDYFNKKGQKMISAPDNYRVAKKENKTIIESLKQDFKDGWVITSTRITYDKDNLIAEITHDAESKVAKPKKYKVKVPVLNGDFEENKETEEYLQALFDTKDNLGAIIRALKKFGKDKTLKLWTPSQSSRKDKQVRSVVLCFGGLDGFVVDGDGWFDNVNGLSRGVIIDSAKQSKSRGKSR